MNRLMTTWAVVGLALMSILHPTPAAERGHAPLEQGYQRFEFTDPQGTVIRCSVWAPKLADGVPVPLVLALHYGGQVTPFYGMGFLEQLVVPGMRSLGAIIVAPDCPGDGWTNEVSERAVLGLLQFAVQSWPVDQRRLVVTGYSMGGFGVWYLAKRHPGVFAAAVPIAGSPGDNRDVSIPVYAIHGRRDEVVDLEPTRLAIEELEARGINAKLVIVKGPTHYETHRFAQPLKGAVEWLEQLWSDER